MLLEGLKFGIAKAQSPDDLPDAVQKELSRFVKVHKHELKPLHLAGEGWRKELEDHARDLVNRLNTPKAGPVNDIFNKLLGTEELSLCWNIDAYAIDNFVSARGDIAHRGRYSDYVRSWHVETHKNNIISAAVDTDNHVAKHIRDNFPSSRKPWNATSLKVNK